MNKKNCENCISFDSSNYENDDRTKYCGICITFTEITFKSHKSCKQFFSKKSELVLHQDKNLHQDKKSELVQFNLFP
jgi:hypothetical protein